MLSLNSFFKKYLAKKLDFDGYYGPQCVDLVQFWIKNLGYPAIWGNAKDLYTNAPTSNFLKIKNTSTNYPLAGDIIIWGSKTGGGAGHTAICISANAKTFYSIDQNWPPGSAVHKQYHPNYYDVIGWLRPKKLIKKVVSDVYQEVPKKYSDGRSRTAKEWFDAYAKTYRGLQTYIAKTKDLEKRISKLELNHAAALVKTTDDYQKVINKLSSDITNLDGKVSGLTNQLNACREASQSLPSIEKPAVPRVTKYDGFWTRTWKRIIQFIAK